MGKIVLSLVFAISFLSLYSGVIFFKKNENKQNFILWTIPSLFITFFITSAVMGILNIFSIPANLITSSVINFLSASVLWFFIISKKKKQNYYFCLTDLIIFFAVLIFTAIYARGEFTLSLVPIYETSDPAVHLQMAMDVINTGAFGKMFFAPYINSLIIGTATPFIGAMDFYKVFVLSDIFFFAVSGLAFYSLVAVKTNSAVKKTVFAVLTFFYMVGYPLNNMVFGFVYLGLSISVIAVILFLFSACFEEESDKTFFTVILSFAMTGLTMCYILFAPIVFISGFVLIAKEYFKEKKLFSLSHILRQLSVFLLPSFISVYYSLFKVGSVNFGAVANEGYIYRDVISNFFFLIFPVILGTVKMIKDKKLSPAFVLGAFTVAQIGVTFYLGLKGTFSSYYAYKTYYVLWLVCFAFAGEYISSIEKKDVYIPVCYLLAVCLLFGISETKIESRINNKNVLFCPRIATTELFDIYHFNTSKIFDGGQKEFYDVWMQKVELYSFVTENLNPDNNIYLADSWENVYWFEALTNQRFTSYAWTDFEEFVKFYKTTEYAVIIKDSETYTENEELFTSQSEVIFENDLGFVIKRTV